MPQAVLQKVGAAGMPQLLLSAAPRLATTLNSNKLSIKVTSSSSGSGTDLFTYTTRHKGCYNCILNKLRLEGPLFKKSIKNTQLYIMTITLLS